MSKHWGKITLLTALLMVLLMTGVALGAPESIIVQDESCRAFQYQVDDALENPLLMNDLEQRLTTAFEHGYSIIGINTDNQIINLNAALGSVPGYIYYENAVADGEIPAGYFLRPDFLVEIAEDGSLVLNEAPLQGPVQVDTGKWIGSGYNVLNNGYVDAANTAPKAAVDLAFLQQHVSNTGENRTDSKTAISQKASEIYSSLNNSTNVTYKSTCFSGSVDVDYNKATTTKRNETLIKHFAIYRNSFVKLELPGDTDLADHLTPIFANRLAGLSSASDRDKAIDLLFRDYGTHIITGYDLGGRAELNYAFSNQASIKEEDIAVAVKASYQGIASSVKGENKTKIVNNMQQMQDYSDTNIALYGGNLTNVSTIEDFKANYATWIASIKDYPTMLNIPNIDLNLTPLWELTGEAGDPSNIESKPIAKAIYERFMTLARERGVLLNGYDFSDTSNEKDFVITDIMVQTGNSKEAALNKFPEHYVIVRLNPDGHDRMELEANKGAGGCYIYIGYKMERFRRPDPNDPEIMIIDQDILDEGIVDIAITCGKNKKKTNYQHVGVDLNATVGGNFIYINFLRYRDDATHKYKPIKDISGYYTQHYTIPRGWRSPSDNYDLNRGAGGAFIYLAVKE